MPIELPQRKALRQIQIQQQNVPLEQILAVKSYNPLAAGVDVLSEALSRRAELRRQGQELAKLEALAQQPAGSFSGLQGDTAKSLASTYIKENADKNEKLRRYQENQTKIRQLEQLGGYEPLSLGEDFEVAKLKFSADLGKATRSEQQAVKRSADEEKAELKKEQFGEKQLNLYAKGLETTGIPTAITIAENILNQLPERGKDVPGFGPIAGQLPDFSLSPEGKSLRQAANTLFNFELKQRSGQAVTDSELMRLKREYGQGKFADEEQLRTGIRQYLQRLQELARNDAAGFKEDVRKEYINQGGRDILNDVKNLVNNPLILKSNTTPTSSNKLSKIGIPTSKNKVGRFVVEVE